MTQTIHPDPYVLNTRTNYTSYSVQSSADKCGTRFLGCSRTWECESVRTHAFCALGRTDQHTVVDKNYSGVLFLAWRCLYAELVRGRVEDVKPVIKNAYRRTLIMLVTRLTAYGEKWLRWVRKNRETGNKSRIPKRHQDKKLIKQDVDGNYTINPRILAEIERTSN